MSKPMIPVPKGEVRIETPDGVSRTYGDVVRNNLTDANWIPEAGFGFTGRAYGAFPSEEGDLGASFGYSQPTMRLPVDE